MFENVTVSLHEGHTINRFRGLYDFLSNFYPVKVSLDGIVYDSVEHSFQAAKTLDPAKRLTVETQLTPGAAKRAGRAIRSLRPDWESVKVDVMLDLLRQKFTYPDLAGGLLATGDAALVENNDWHDVFWGVCQGVGKNMLGILLMRVRAEIRESIVPSMDMMCNRCLARLIGHCCPGVAPGETCLGGSGPVYAGMT